MEVLHCFCILGNGNCTVKFNEMDISTFLNIHFNMYKGAKPPMQHASASSLHHLPWTEDHPQTLSAP